MKNLKIIKALFLVLFIVLSHSAFSSEPQMKYITIKNHKKVKVENLEKYEINNKELVQLYGFNTPKKLIKKAKPQKQLMFARNIEMKNFIIF